MRSASKVIRYRYRRARIRYAVAHQSEVKIILGAAETSQPGWYGTNEQWLDITKPGDWTAIFGERRIVSHAVAEHVFEHLTPDETMRALTLIASYLTPRGRVRIAVPDGYNPNSEYLRNVCVGGVGDDAADHKQLLNVDVLSFALRRAGFEPRQVEGYQKDGSLVQERWSDADGFIRRSRQNAPNPAWKFPDATTSLIVDAVLR